MENSIIFFRKNSERAFIPKRATFGAVGFDLFSAYSYIILPGKNCLIDTEIQIFLPEGSYGRVAPRSGLALKKQIMVGAGVVDPDYRGNLRVLLFNFGPEPFVVSPGDRIAQLVCEKVIIPSPKEVESLPPSKRGDCGFGSTGV